VEVLSREADLARVEDAWVVAQRQREQRASGKRKAENVQELRLIRSLLMVESQFPSPPRAPTPVEIDPSRTSEAQNHAARIVADNTYGNPRLAILILVKLDNYCGCCDYLYRKSCRHAFAP
jgi:hypothetical protein